MPIHVIGQTNGTYTVVVSDLQDGTKVLENMKQTLGSFWTIKNDPYYVKTSYESQDEWDIEDTVLRTMVKYGVSKVRGGSYQDLELSEDDRIIAERNVKEMKMRYSTLIQKVVRGYLVRKE